jgi:hypothetical protein
LRQGALIIGLLIVAGTTAARAYEIAGDSIRRHIEVIAHDSIEGREVGTEGEWKAARYLIDVFKGAGLKPKGDSTTAAGDTTFLQPFEFTKAIDLGDNNRLVVNDVELELHEEFVPLHQSASMQFEFDTVIYAGYGITTDSVDGVYDDYEGLDIDGKAVMVKRFSPPDSAYPDVKFQRYAFLTYKINEALRRGATGIFFVTPLTDDDTLASVGPTRVSPKDVPVIFMRRKGLERLGVDLKQPALGHVEGQTELLTTPDTGYNVISYLPGRSDTTVVIGAHYDHLGWGGPGSRYRGDEPKIHNGADDNGSGTAVVLELARYFAAKEEPPRYSMLFTGFSGEEHGILGSSYYARNMTVDTSKVRMMVNLDMVGRLKDQDGLVVFGTGTAREFKEYFDTLTVERFNLIRKTSGIGASDHTAFYTRNVPVLFFFTGAHQDYHKPSDDVHLIDFEGTADVARFVAETVEYFNTVDHPLEFQRTKSEGGRHSQRFSVTLGIMPDFIAEVEGLRVDAVSPERPGERAGLLQGDIIIQMGDTQVGDIYDYMTALGRYRKGDTTTVVVERDTDTLSLEVVFE